MLIVSSPQILCLAFLRAMIALGLIKSSSMSARPAKGEFACLYLIRSPWSEN